MNFNNPEDACSSSPISGSSSPAAPSPGSGEIESDADSDDDDEDQTDTAMSLDMDDATIRSTASADSPNNSTGSSAKLDEALRQAARQAGTQALELEENGEMSMDIAGDEITSAFRPWVSQAQGANQTAMEQDKENLDPFSGIQNAAC